MNVFSIAGDFSHLLAIVILLHSIVKKRSCHGVSGKTQVLFALGFMTRYLDLLTRYTAIYNTLMKLTFIATTIATCYLIFFKFRDTYDDKQDRFSILYLLPVVAVVAVLVNEEFSVVQVLWTFSIYLEAVAILPQLFMILQTGEAKSIPQHYVNTLVAYRLLYMANWVHRFYDERYYDLTAIVAGCVQALLYVYFMYLYVVQVSKRKNYDLPS